MVREIGINAIGIQFNKYENRSIGKYYCIWESKKRWEKSLIWARHFEMVSFEDTFSILVIGGLGKKTLMIYILFYFDFLEKCFIQKCICSTLLKNVSNDKENIL